jgi:hypothetical protein
MRPRQTNDRRLQPARPLHRAYQPLVLVPTQPIARDGLRGTRKELEPTIKPKARNKLITICCWLPLPPSAPPVLARLITALEEEEEGDAGRLDIFVVGGQERKEWCLATKGKANRLRVALGAVPNNVTSLRRPCSS